MRILMIMESHKAVGGAEIASMRLSDLLVSHGHQVAHFTLGSAADAANCAARHFFPNPALLTDNALFDITTCQNLFSRTLRAFYPLVSQSSLARHLHRAIQTFQPDVIHHLGVFAMNTPQVFEVIQRSGLPSVLTVQDPWPVCPASSLLHGNGDFCDAVCATESRPGTSIFKHQCMPNVIASAVYARKFSTLTLSRTFLNSFTLITAPSNAAAGLLQSVRQVPPERLKVVYYAPDATLVDRSPGFGKWATPPYFLFSGKLARHKGIFLLLEAFRHLPDFPLVIAGSGTQGQHVRDFIGRHRLQHVQQLGWQSGEALWQLYQNAYAVVLPSMFFDVAPLVIQESFAHGKPVVGADVGGIPDFVVPGETGLLFERGNMADLKSKVMHLWDNPELAATLGQNAYRLFRSRHAPEQVYQSAMDAYETAICLQASGQTAPVSR